MRQDADPRREVLHAALRGDLAAFTQRTFQTVAPGRTYQHNWHLEVLADRIERCLAREYRHLAIAVPPRSLKSVMVSVAMPALALGRDPAQRIICASYDGALAEKHARDCHAVIGSAWYRELFPATRLDRSKNAVTEFTTTQGGYRLATSVGGTLTGRGGNLIVVDDPLKAGDALSEARREAVNQWFSNTLYSRLDDKGNDRIIVVMQRLHADDLIGHLLESGDEWHYLRLPVIAEEDERFVLRSGRVLGRAAGEALHGDRESVQTLDHIRRQLGSYDFAAQYQQDPLPLEGGLVKWTWFRTYETPPEPEEGDFITQSWDTASKAGELNDWSVCTTWLRRGETHYLLNVCRERVEYPTLKRLVVEMRDRHRADAVLIEDGASGTQLIQDLQAEGRVHPIAITPHGDKAMRMFATTARIESGAVLIPAEAPWLDAFKAELLQFPHGRYNDQVDSLSQYLNWAASHGIGADEFCSVDGGIAAEWDACVGLASGSPPPWLTRGDDSPWPRAD